LVNVKVALTTRREIEMVQSNTLNRPFDKLM